MQNVVFRCRPHNAYCMQLNTAGSFYPTFFSYRVAVCLDLSTPGGPRKVMHHFQDAGRGALSPWGMDAGETKGM